MGWDNHFLDAGEDEKEEDEDMSHSDLSIEEQQKEEFFKTMRESADYKFGYCRSAINTAIHFLTLGKVEQATTCLKDCAELMRG